jgi:DNA-directed RNA polymerase subunit RPC12/RpoP
MRRNCICRCGAQVRASIQAFKRGIDCPNCGHRVTFEEQTDTSEIDPGLSPSAELSNRAGLGMKTKFGGVKRRSVLSKGFGLGILLVLGLWAIRTASWIGVPSADAFRLGDTPTSSPIDLPQKSRSEDIDWSKQARWDTQIDPIEGTFCGSRTAKVFTTEASANRYDAIEPLFDYGPMIDKIQQAREELKFFRSDSPEALEQQLRSLVLSFLYDTKSITLGYHDWRIVGLVTQEDRTAVLIRYYRETTTPIELFDSEELLVPLTKTITFNNFRLYCNNLFKTKAPERSNDPKLRGYMHRHFYADKNFGYIVLMLTGNAPNDEIEDVFDFQVQRPLSQLCAVWTGASTINIDQLPPDKKPLPGPLDTDLRAIQEWINLRSNKIQSADTTAIRNSLNNLYAQTNDPLMLDLLGRLESDLGNRKLALENFRKAEQGRFQSLDAYRAKISTALESNDSELLIERLNDLNNYWSVKLTGLEAVEDRKKFYKFQTYWRRSQDLGQSSATGSL